MRAPLVDRSEPLFTPRVGAPNGAAVRIARAAARAGAPVRTRRHQRAAVAQARSAAPVGLRRIGLCARSHRAIAAAVQRSDGYAFELRRRKLPERHEAARPGGACHRPAAAEGRCEGGLPRPA